jgi:tetratricopeptide (TPR) repeat protein
MSRLLITLLFFFISLFISNELKSEVQGLRLAKEYNKLTTLDLLDEGLFDLVQSGLTTIDFTKVRQQLLAIQSDIYIYSKQQQAFYWYNLAISNRHLNLPSDKVILHIERALSFSPDIDSQQYFKILIKAIDLLTDYQQYEQLIVQLEQLRELTKSELNPLTQRLLQRYENLKARAYYQTGQLPEAELYLNQLIDEAEKSNSRQNVNWYVLLGHIHQMNKNKEQEIAILRKQFEFFPSVKLEKELVYLQRNQTFDNGD